MTTATHSPAAQPVARRYMGVTEAAEYLGVSRAKMSRLFALLVKRGRIPQRRDLVDSRRAHIPVALLDQILDGDLVLDEPPTSASA